jgi:hypothetical protein
MGAQYPSSLAGGYGIAGSHGNEDLNPGCVVMPAEQRWRGRCATLLVLQTAALALLQSS